MNDHDAAQDELIELATALSDGDFTPAGRLAARELLTAHGDLLTVYVRILLLQSLLGQEVEGLRQGMTEAESGAWRLVASAGDDVHASRDDPSTTAPAAQSPSKLPQAVGKHAPTRIVRKQRPWLPRWGWAMASAFTLVLMLVGWQA